VIEPIFEGARGSCVAHPDVRLAPDQVECDDCKIIRRNLSLKPPFIVVCHDTHWGVKKDSQYKVLWVLRDASKEHQDRMIGYVFEDDKGNLDKHVYDPLKFTPLDFLEKEEEEESEVAIIG
jgi:hypothetical protein